MRFCFAGPAILANSANMNPSDPVIEEARRAGIDLSLLDSNLALSCEQRWQMHDEALAKVRAHEKDTDLTLPVSTIIRRTKSGVELLLEVNDCYNVQLLA